MQRGARGHLGRPAMGAERLGQLIDEQGNAALELFFDGARDGTLRHFRPCAGDDLRTIVRDELAEHTFVTTVGCGWARSEPTSRAT